MTQQPSDPIVPPLDAAPPPGSSIAREPGRGSLPLDLASGYVLTAARVAAWAGVSALVYRGNHWSEFGLLVLLRGTITLVGYTSLGLGPAMVRMLADTGRLTIPVPATPVPFEPAGGRRAGGGPQSRPTPTLDYHTPPSAIGDGSGDRPEPTPEQRVFSSGACLALQLALAALLVTLLYASNVSRVHVLHRAQVDAAVGLVAAFGIGTAVRILSEPSSAVLQARGFLAADNLIAAGAELFWLAMVALRHPNVGAGDAGAWYLVASVGLLIGRGLAAGAVARGTVASVGGADRRRMRALLTFGAGVLVAQLADFLYAPAAYVVINRFLSPADLVAYAPAVQVDGALLLLVGGVAATLFPRAAAAHAAGDLPAVRRYYVVGTLAGGAVLAAAAGATALLAGPLLVAWLGEDLPATRAILPLVLVHTVVGGTAAVGRSVLMGMGRVRALTASALVAGVANVALGIALAVGLGWGLRGIVIGTVVVVVARAGIWMPWYVLRALRGEAERAASEAP